MQKCLFFSFAGRQAVGWLRFPFSRSRVPKKSRATKKTTRPRLRARLRVALRFLNGKAWAQVRPGERKRCLYPLSFGERPRRSEKNAFLSIVLSRMMNCTKKIFFCVWRLSTAFRECVLPDEWYLCHRLRFCLSYSLRPPLGGLPFGLLDLWKI